MPGCSQPPVEGTYIVLPTPAPYEFGYPIEDEPVWWNWSVPYVHEGRERDVIFEYRFNQSGVRGHSRDNVGVETNWYINGAWTEGIVDVVGAIPGEYSWQHWTSDHTQVITGETVTLDVTVMFVLLGRQANAQDEPYLLLYEPELMAVRW